MFLLDYGNLFGLLRDNLVLIWLENIVFTIEVLILLK